MALLGCSDEGFENEDGKESEILEGEGRLPGLLYEDDLVLYSESEEELRTMVG